MNSTIVSCFINLNDNLNKSTEWYIEKGEFLFKVDAYIIFFVDSHTYESVRKLRERYNMLHKTHFIITSLREFPLYNYRNKIASNRNGNPMYTDNRNTPDYFVLVASKPGMIKRAIDANPFKSTHFIWVDFGIKGTKYTQEGMIERILPNIRDKISCCYIHYREKNLLKNYSEWYKFGYCGIAGGVISGNIEHLIKFNNLFDEKFKEVVDKGYGHAEEQIITELESDHPELFDVYTGDYSSIVSNYLMTTQDIDSILTLYIANARTNGKSEHSYKACLKLEHAMRDKLITLNDWQFMKYCDEYFLSAWYTDRNKCLDILKNLENRMNLSQGLCSLFMTNLDYYTQNFDFVTYILPDKKKAKSFQKVSDVELNSLIKDYQVFIYTDDEKISGKYLLTSNPVIRPTNKVKDLRYDLIL